MIGALGRIALKHAIMDIKLENELLQLQGILMELSALAMLRKSTTATLRLALLTAGGATGTPGQSARIPVMEVHVREVGRSLSTTTHSAGLAVQTRARKLTIVEPVLAPTTASGPCGPFGPFVLPAAQGATRGGSGLCLELPLEVAWNVRAMLRRSRSAMPGRVRRIVSSGTGLIGSHAQQLVVVAAKHASELSQVQRRVVGPSALILSERR